MAETRKETREQKHAEKINKIYSAAMELMRNENLMFNGRIHHIIECVVKAGDNGVSYSQIKRSLPLGQHAGLESAVQAIERTGAIRNVLRTDKRSELHEVYVANYEVAGLLGINTGNC